MFVVVSVEMKQKKHFLPEPDEMRVSAYTLSNNISLQKIVFLMITFLVKFIVLVHGYNVYY